MHKLNYMTPVPNPFAAWWIAGPVLANAIAAALGMAILRYPRGQGGAFFPLETNCVFLLAPVALGVGIAAACGLWRYYKGSGPKRVGICLLVVLVSLGPLPLHNVIYEMIYAYKGLNFGPG